MKKQIVISMLAMASIVACNKNEESQPQVQGQTGMEQLTILKADTQTGDICVSIKDGETERDSCFNIGVPFHSATPTIVIGQIAVKMGEGDNIHDSLIDVYAPVPQPDFSKMPCDTCK
ncbi:MAG: hypothetical protein MJ197_00560 [Bacteroidales bacterium]|nr:hypothetical protein [Bacteroidales bacterium]